MTTAEPSTPGNRHHVVCDDESFWQWHGAVTRAEAHQHADQLARDPQARFATIWILPCDGTPTCATCAAFTTNTEHADDLFPTLVARHKPYWRRPVTTR